jgi:RNA polymerase sigma factor (sigma-70 family)
VRFLSRFRRNNTTIPEAEQLSAYRRTGDVKLLGELYARYMDMVFGVCYHYLRDEDESKDAVMQIFEKLVQDLKVHEVSNFKSWLHSVARNYCLMQIRAKRIFIAASDITEEDEPQFETGEADIPFALEYQLTSLENCMQALINEQRVAIQLFYVEEKCYKEIASETGFDFNKVKSYIQNGKRNLKICMDKNGRV